MSLSKILQSTILFQTGDPRDKVYALVGLTKNSWMLSGTGNANHIRIDYDLSPEQVFADSVKLAIEQDKTLNALSFAGQATTRSSGWSPSWAPDWSLVKWPPTSYQTAGEHRATKDSEVLVTWPDESRPYVMGTYSFKLGYIAALGDRAKNERGRQERDMKSVLKQWLDLAETMVRADVIRTWKGFLDAFLMTTV